MSKFIIEKQVKGTVAENLAKNYFLNISLLVIVHKHDQSF